MFKRGLKNAFRNCWHNTFRNCWYVREGSCVWSHEMWAFLTSIVRLKSILLILLYKISHAVTNLLWSWHLPFCAPHPSPNLFLCWISSHITLRFRQYRLFANKLRLKIHANLTWRMRLNRSEIKSWYTCKILSKIRSISFAHIQTVFLNHYHSTPEYFPVLPFFNQNHSFILETALNQESN